MAGSILVAVRSALIDGLKAPGTGITSTINDATHEVEIAFQWKQDESVREWIYTGSARFSHASAAMRAGRNYRDEVGKFSVVVLVAGVDLTQEETSTRCMEIATAVEEWIADRKNNDLGVTGLQTLVVDGDGALDEMFRESGHLAIAEIPVKYTARLT